MNSREIIKVALDGEVSPYVPWSFKFAQETSDIEPVDGFYDQSGFCALDFFFHCRL